jgi:hypothetical protein
MREESVAAFLKRATAIGELEFAAKHGFHFTTYELTDAELWNALGEASKLGISPLGMSPPASAPRRGATKRDQDLSVSSKSRAVNLRWILDRVTDVE